MKYFSTRDTERKDGGKDASYVIKEGLAPDGGLYIPDELPIIDGDFIDSLIPISYQERAAVILSLFLNDYTYGELFSAANRAYAPEKFSPRPAPLTKLGDNSYMLELWHGPTCAFKDMALQIMPILLSSAIEKQGGDKDALILVATSGDTGKAALEGYKDVPRIKISVFYPTGGVSEIQKKQMASQEGDNVSVTAIRGNFDDAQTAVKKVFVSEKMLKAADAEGYFFSSANSINWGRLAPQIVYYISAYCDLLDARQIKPGEKINICVPTGNFGNILAAYIAKKAGLPVAKLICASNSNHILTDFFETGVYDRVREFKTTVSPSMDILISSNLERLLSFVAGAEKTAGFMKDLSTKGVFTVDSEVKKVLDEDFCAFWLDEDGTKQTIHDIFSEYSYLCDTHTAVAAGCLKKYREKTGDMTKTVVASTASPYKFAPAVCDALKIKVDGNEYDCIDALEKESKMPVPEPLAKLKNKKNRFDLVIDKDEIENRVLALTQENK